MWIFSYSEAHTPCRVDAMCFGRALQWGEWPCLARQMVAVCHAWEDCHWVFWWWAMLGHYTNSSKMTPGYNWGENNMKYNSFLFILNESTLEVIGPRQKWLKNAFDTFLNQNMIYPTSRLLIHVMLDAFVISNFPLISYSKPLSLDLPLVICYRLFWTLAISNYFAFPLRVRNRKCQLNCSAQIELTFSVTILYMVLVNFFAVFFFYNWHTSAQQTPFMFIVWRRLLSRYLSLLVRFMLFIFSSQGLLQSGICWQSRHC